MSKSKVVVTINTEEIKVGQIWIVETDVFKGSKDCNSSLRDVKEIHTLKKGERIEIRYPYEWHYRTEDNIYLNSSDEDIKKNCVLLGDIDEKVRTGNKAKLEEILRLNLYTQN